MNTVQKKTFQVRLKELRKSSGRTQEEVANDLFFSRTALSNYESGKRYPSIEILSQLAKYFNVDVGYLLPSGEGAHRVDEYTKRRIINFKYLIKERYLDLSGLSDVSKVELIDYYRFLKSKEEDS